MRGLRCARHAQAPLGTNTPYVLFGDRSTWVHEGERRWPVRHHSTLSIERTRRPTWWKPYHPNRKRSFNSGLSANSWDRLTGWSLSKEHQYVVRLANRRYRHRAHQLVRTGRYDLMPYVTVGWVW